MTYIKITHYVQEPTGLMQGMRPTMTTKAVEAWVRVEAIDVITNDKGMAIIWVAGKPMMTKTAYAEMLNKIGIIEQ